MNKIVTLKNKNIKLVKFILYLILLSTLVTILKVLNLEYNGSSGLLFTQLLNTIYLFTPAIAVIIVERNVKKITKDYNISIKTIKLKDFLYLTFLTLILFPLTLLSVIYIFGNIFDIHCFGKIITSISESYTFSGIVLPGSVFVKFILLTIISLVIALVCGLSYNLIFALGGEVAWRGFMNDNLKLNNFKKNLIIGLVWALWSLPIILVRTLNFYDVNYFEIINTFLICISLSFYLSNIVKNTGTVMMSSAIVGIINSSSIFFLIDGNQDYNLIGTNGLIAIIPIIILILLSKNYFSKRKNAVNI